MDVSLQRTKSLIRIRILWACRIPFQGRVETILLQSGSLLFSLRNMQALASGVSCCSREAQKADKPLNEAIFQHFQNMSKL